MNKQREQTVTTNNTSYNEKQTKFTLFIIDSHELVIAGLKHILKSKLDIELVGVCSDPEESLKQIALLKPDVVMTEPNREDGRGMEIIYALLRKDPKQKILAFTATSEKACAIWMFQQGVKGYLTKTAQLDEIPRAIREVFLRGYYLMPEIAKLYINSPGLAHNQTEDSLLSDREKDIILMIMDGHKAPSIADTMNLSPNTINTYRYLIFEKFGVKSDLEIIQRFWYLRALLTNSIAARNIDL